MGSAFTTCIYRGFLLQFCAAVTIGFMDTEVTVGESAGPVILNVALLSGSLERDVFVDFTTQDGTAVGKSKCVTGFVRFYPRFSTYGILSTHTHLYMYVYVHL